VNQPNCLFGMQILACDWAADTVWTQVRFPRSKKRRIRRKWAKDRRNYRAVTTPWEHAYVIEGKTIVMHPRMVAKLEQASREFQQATCDRIGREIAARTNEPSPFFAALPTLQAPLNAASSIDALADKVFRDLVRLAGIPRLLLDGKASYSSYYSLPRYPPTTLLL
jgi:hypothetical protein